jgi:hypothetical protein
VPAADEEEMAARCRDGGGVDVEAMMARRCGG